MRIAYISYEYPPDTAVGGIATYVDQVSKIMQNRGHDVEVFCASEHQSASETINGIKVHRVLCKDRDLFREIILPLFAARNQDKEFDIVESPEFSGDALAIKKSFPSIPLVVKLHTPWFLIGEINGIYFGAFRKLKFLASGLIRGKLYKRFWKPRDKKTDADYLITILADEIHTPSVSLGDIVSKRWGIARKRIINVPNPYIPGEDLLSIPIATEFNVITYIGRLEVRKGLVELAKAVGIVLKKHPSVKFRFVGSVQNSPVTGLNMKEYLLRKLRRYKNNIEFLEVAADDIAKVYAGTDICVFPSIWENFPNTCLEAMSAGRGIVASNRGGMLDMLGDCGAGVLVDPSKPTEIATALIQLIENIELRTEKGGNARMKVTSAYNSVVIGSLIEQKYLALVSA